MRPKPAPNIHDEYTTNKNTAFTPNHGRKHATSNREGTHDSAPSLFQRHHLDPGKKRLLTGFRNRKTTKRLARPTQMLAVLCTAETRDMQKKGLETRNFAVGRHAPSPSLSDAPQLLETGSLPAP